MTFGEPLLFFPQVEPIMAKSIRAIQVELLFITENDL
jgi:hypothetical protein